MQEIDLIQKLKIEDGDVLVVRLSDMVSGLEYKRIAESMSQTIRAINRKASVIILPYMFTEMGTISEETMKAFGWKRIEND